MDLTQVKHEIETLAEKHRDEFETVCMHICSSGAGIP